jgi:hypothetical protein
MHYYSLTDKEWKQEDIKELTKVTWYKMATPATENS